MGKLSSKRRSYSKRRLYSKSKRRYSKKRSKYHGGAAASKGKKKKSKKKKRSRSRRKSKSKSENSLYNLIRRFKKLDVKVGKELEEQLIFVNDWKKQILIPYLRKHNSYAVFIINYKFKLTTTCALKDHEYQQILEIAMQYDREADNKDELISKAHKFTDDFIRVCGVETIECLGI